MNRALYLSTVLSVTTGHCIFEWKRTNCFTDKVYKLQKVNFYWKLQIFFKLGKV